MPDFDHWRRQLADPQAVAEMREIKRQANLKAFMAREISDDVFRAYLYGTGLRGAELATIFTAHWTDRYDAEKRCRLQRKS